MTSPIFEQYVHFNFKLQILSFIHKGKKGNKHITILNYRLQVLITKEKREITFYKGFGDKWRFFGECVHAFSNRGECVHVFSNREGDYEFQTVNCER